MRFPPRDGCVCIFMCQRLCTGDLKCIVLKHAGQFCSSFSRNEYPLFSLVTPAAMTVGTGDLESVVLSTPWVELGALVCVFKAKTWSLNYWFQSVLTMVSGEQFSRSSFFHSSSGEKWHHAPRCSQCSVYSMSVPETWRAWYVGHKSMRSEFPSFPFMQMLNVMGTTYPSLRERPRRGWG